MKNVSGIESIEIIFILREWSNVEILANLLFYGSCQLSKLNFFRKTVLVFMVVMGIKSPITNWNLHKYSLTPL